MKNTFNNEAFIRQEKRVIAYFKNDIKEAKKDFNFRIKLAQKRIKESEKNIKSCK